MVKHNSIYLVAEQPTFFNAHWYEDFVRGIMSRLSKGTALNILDAGKPDFKIDLDSIDLESRKMIVTGNSLLWLYDLANYLISKEIHPIIACVQPDDLKCCYSSITFDYMSASIDMAKYLISLGMTRIAIFGSDPDLRANRLKCEGYYTALNEKGIGSSRSNVYINKGLISECSAELLNNINKYDAILCINDYSALFLMSMLSQHGIQVPDDLYITGFGDTISGKVSSPAVTSSTFDFYDAGRKSVDIYNTLVKDPDLASLSASIKCKIKVRGSTNNRIPEAEKPAGHIAPPNIPCYSGNLKNSEALENLGIHSSRNNSLNFNNSMSDSFFNNPDIYEIICLERLLRQCDDFDGLILEKIAQGVKYEDMAEHLNMSERTIQYRLNKMLTSSGKNSRHELIALVKKYLGDDAGTRISFKKR